MSYHKTITSVKSSATPNAKSRENSGTESRGPLKAFQNGQTRLSSKGSELSRKSGSKRTWVAKSTSVRVKLRSKTLASKNKYKSSQTSEKRQASSKTFSRKSKKTTISRRTYRLVRSSTTTPKNRFSAYQTFMDVHNKQKVAKKLSEIKDAKERRCFLDYIATMRFEENETIHKYQLKKHQTKISDFLTKLKKKSIIEEDSEESSSRDLDSVDNIGGRKIMDRIKFQKNKLRRTSTLKQPMTNKIIKTMVAVSNTVNKLPGLRRIHTNAQIPYTPKKNYSSNPATPNLLKYSTPVSEEGSTPSKDSGSNINSTLDKEPLLSPVMSKEEGSLSNSPSFGENNMKESQNPRTKKNLFDFSDTNKMEHRDQESSMNQESDGTDLTQPIHNRLHRRMASLDVIESSHSILGKKKEEAQLKKPRRPSTSRPTSRTRSGLLNNRRRICLLKGEQKERLASVVIRYWDEMIKKNEKRGTC